VHHLRHHAIEGDGALRDRHVTLRREKHNNMPRVRRASWIPASA
jgi:hypothetical protein